jgi:hypothetical protein
METDHNIYLRPGDPALPPLHARNLRLDTKVDTSFSFSISSLLSFSFSFFFSLSCSKVAALACDQLEEAGPLKTVFRSDSFREFLRLLLQLPALHRNVDPIGAVFANIYHDGYSHNWHFDESHWSTTVLLQVLATPR